LIAMKFIRHLKMVKLKEVDYQQKKEIKYFH
jgi:hypothetical protein